MAKQEQDVGTAGAEAGVVAVASTDGTPLLELRGIRKSYGSTLALRDGALRLFPGRVHALLGENGAGKSTMIKIAVGAVESDAGWVSVSGEAADFRSVRDAVAAGVIPIFQHLSLFPHLSVLDNLSSFAFARRGVFRAAQARVSRAEARCWLETVGLSVGLDVPLQTLSLGQRQLVEIARGIGQRCRVLVLDEPTAALGRDEAQRLFTVVHGLCAAGAAVLLISHKLEEVEDVADDVSILRDGRTVVDCAPKTSLSRADMIAAMLGQGVEFKGRRLPEPGPVLLRAEEVSAPGLAPFDLDIRAGEIVGLAGLVGSGANEIGAVLAGAMSGQGHVTLAGKPLRFADRTGAVRAGVGFVPADRQAEGLFLDGSAVENTSASALGLFAPRGILDPRRERALALPWMERLKLHPRDPLRQAKGFSGGNQQKLLLARNLAIPGLKVLVALEPTRGVDIGAREIIHDAILDAARAGAAVLIASTDLEEVLALSHRILVVSAGRLGPAFAKPVHRDQILGALTERRAA